LKDISNFSRKLSEYRPKILQAKNQPKNICPAIHHLKNFISRKKIFLKIGAGFIYADGSREGMVFSGGCLCVCLSAFLHFSECLLSPFVVS